MPSSSTAQRWLTKATPSSRSPTAAGARSCGGRLDANSKAPPCELGYIHLMSRAYEVRDVQTLLGKLADEGVINPQAIGATGGSYGGGMSLQLGSLKDRVELPNHELIPWESPGGKPMKIAATAPEFPWTDLAQSLHAQRQQPRLRGRLDLRASPLRNHRFGIEKNNWNGSLFLAGLPAGVLYAPNRTTIPKRTSRPGTTSTSPAARMTANRWRSSRKTAAEPQPVLHGPDRAAGAVADGERLERRPVPGRRNGQVLQQGPRGLPDQAMQLFYSGPRPQPAFREHRLDRRRGQIPGRENTWFAYYLKGEGGEPAEAHRRRDDDHELLPADRGWLGRRTRSAQLGEPGAGRGPPRGAAEQTILAPGTRPRTPFTSGNVCTTAGGRRQRLGRDVQARAPRPRAASRSPARRP